jgi:hypothetical protein
MGNRSARITLAGANVSDSQSSPSAAAALVTFESDGDILEATSAGSSDVGDWITPKAFAPDAYTIRATVNSGAVSGGSAATGSDLALSSNRTWRVDQSGAGTATVNLTIAIKLAGAVVASATWVLTATVI